MRWLSFQRRNWFWLTLRGYTVTFITLDRQYTVKHRPFRRPLMLQGNPRSTLRGLSYKAVIFDEVVQMSPSDIEKLNLLVKQKKH
jgi:hypothetical protein